MSKKWNRLLAHSGIIVAGLFFLIPFLWMISTSFKSDAQIYSAGTSWIPSPFQFRNYRDAVTVIPYMSYVWNTLILVFWTMIGRVIVNPMVGYAFARLRWPGRNALFVVVLATMMLPFQVTMIPLYGLFVDLKMINTIWPLVIPAFLGDAFLIFLLRQFFLTLPEELSEASRVDGCSEFRIFTQIVLPLCKPVLATVVLFSFMWTWTDFLGPMIYLTEKSKWTISIGMMQYLSEHSLQWGQLMAGAAIFMIPMVILFLFTQRTFVEGITVTGLKG